MVDRGLMMLASGQRVAHYTLEEQVGGGASGEVWRAHDGARLVAIKFMHEALITGENAARHVARLQTEIRALELLVGVQNVPMLYGYDLTFARPYLVMEYISSRSWERFITSGEMQQVKLLRRLSLLNTVAVTLSEIHRRGVIHRDLKPGNLHGTDKPYLLDYSIAVEKRHAAQAEPHVGTAIYMPPPDGHAPDELDDIYGFGLVTYEVLFGQHAIFTPETTRQTMTELHQMAHDALQARTWRLPSRIAWAELPVNLRGANLDLLDKVFQRVLGARKTRYTNLLYFIADLHTAIVTPENRPYLNLLPPMLTPNPNAIQEDTDFTIHEARKAYTQTDLSESEKRRRQDDPPAARSPTHKRRFWLLGRRRD